MGEPAQTNVLESFSKFTGLPVTEANKPKDAISSFSEFVGKPIETKPDEMPYKLSGLDLAARDINLSNIYTDPITNYASYKVPLSPYADWNEIRAQNQGFGEKLGRGALKMLTTTAGAVTENTVGIVSGISSMIAGGTYANNPVGRSIDQMNEWMAENLPHYYTKAELDPTRSAADSLSSANFWTDKFANGIGYSLGSLATAWLTGGAGLLGRTINIAGKGLAAAGRAGQAGKLISTGEAMKNMYAASKMIATGSKLTTDLTKYGNLARGLNAAKYLEVGAMMSLAESSVEAREKSKMYVQEREQEWLENNPGKSLEEMGATDREAINQEARSVENFTFGWNMPILMATNLFQFGNMAMGIKTGTKAVEKTILDEAGKRAVDIPKTALTRFLSRANKYTAPVYQNSLTEAFQEGAQFMIGETGIDYYRNKFDSGIDDLTSSAIKGLSNTFGTADGIESMLLGALTGGTMGVGSTTIGGAAKERNMRDANTKKLLAITNSETFLSMKKSLEQKKELLQFGTALKAANALGNVKLANELRKNFMAQHAIMFDNLDALDLAFEKLDDMAKMPEAEFAALNEFDTSKPITDQTGGKTQQMLVDEWKNEMQKYVDMGRKLDDLIRFMTPNKSGFGKLLMSKEEKTQQAAQDLYNQRLKNILLTSMIGMESRDEEIDKAYEKLTDLSPALKNFDRNKLVTLIKRNQITVDSQGNLVLPKSLVDVTISDVEEQEKKEGQPKPEPTTEEAAKKKNIKENETLTGILKTAVEESTTLNKLDKMEFDQTMADLISSIYTRELASTAFDELLKSPEKREITLAAKQAAEVQAKVVKANKEAESLIDSADSTKQLDDLIDHESLSPEMRLKVKKKYKELKEVEEEYKKDYQVLSIETLQDLVADIEAIEADSPAKAAALIEVLNSKLNETNEQKEVKDGTLSAEEAKAKAEAEEALKRGASEKASEEADPNLNEKVYETQMALLSTDGRRIRVNGVVYNNLHENPLDAITRTALSEPTEEEAGVEKVTLTNEQQQSVEFTGITALELADVMLMAYASQGTIESINLSEPLLKKAIKDRLDALEKIKSVIDVDTEYDPNEISLQSLNKILDKYRTHLSNILSVYNMAKEKFMRQGRTLADMNQDEDFIRARGMYSATLKELKRVTADYHRKATLPSTTPFVEDPPGQMSEDAEQSMKHKIGEAQTYLDLADETIQNLGDKIKKIEVAQALGMNNPANANELARLKKALAVAQAERDIYQANYNSLVKEYGYNKSSQASKDVQDSQGASQLAQEQGPGTTNQGAVQVPESQQVDINDIEDAPLLPEVIISQDFIERDTDESQDNLNSQDFEEEEEETADDSDPEEDEDPVQLNKRPSSEGEQQKNNELDVAVIKTQYQYTNGYDNILIDDENGNPVANSLYYGTPEEDYEDGYRQFRMSNGEKVAIEIYPHLLTDSNLTPIGSKVFFEVKENTVWFSKSGISAEDAWKTVPIYVAVEVNGELKRVGMLEGYNEKKPNKNRDREEIYNMYKNGKNPSTILTNKYVDSQNIANGMTEDGQVFFFDPVPVDEDGNILHTPTLAIAIPTKGEPKWEVVLEGDVVNFGEEKIPDDLASRTSTRTLGTVAIIVRTPNGDLTYLRATTKMMTEVGYSAVEQIINEGIEDPSTIDTIGEIVGLNEIAEYAVDDKNRDLLILEVFGKTEDSPRAFTFWLPSAESYIRVNTNELAAAISGDSFTYSFVNGVKTEGGQTNFEKDPSRKDWSTHEKGVAKAFKDAVMKRRYQVAAGLLMTNKPYTSKVSGIQYNSYLEYLTHPDEISDISKDQGHSGILSSDVYLDPLTFSPYFNVVMNFGELMDSWEKVEDNTKVSKPVAKAKIVKKEPIIVKQEDYTDESDMDDESDVDTTNSLLDDEELEVAESSVITDAEETEDTDDNTNSLERLIASRKTSTPKTEKETEEVTINKKVKSQGLSGKVAEVEEETVDPIVQILNNISNNDVDRDEAGNMMMFIDPITGEETHYLIRGEKYERTTSRTSDPFTGDPQLQKASSTAGKAIHTIAEDYLMGRQPKKPANMSSPAFLNLMTQLRDIQQVIRGRGQTVISTEMVVYKTDLGLAGKFDILTRDRKGQYELYDIKTGTESGLENYEGSKFGKSKRQQHGAQLSVYAYMLNGHAMDNGVKVKIQKGHVLYIPISYNQDGVIDRVSKFAEKNFVLNLNIDKVLSGEVDFSFKESKISSDPTIKNAGKKTSSAKSTGKKVIVKQVKEDEEDEDVKPVGRITKKNLAQAVISAKSSKGVSADPSGALKAQIIKNGAMNDMVFADIIEDMFGITVTEEEAAEIQEEIVQKLCK